MESVFNLVKNDSRKDLFESLLFLADSGLILSQRQSEWTGHGPVLEQDIAITNINLDLLGQSRLLYQYSADILNSISGIGATEDTLAFLRTEREFRNPLLCELPNGDWGQTILRLYIYSVYTSELFKILEAHPDETISAISTKSLKEISYHIKWSGEWLLRLGDGTEESHIRMKNAIEYVWPFTGELFTPAPYEKVLNVDHSQLKNNWETSVSALISEATLEMPVNVFMQSGGKSGIHTEHLGFMLSEMQYLQRTYPGAEW